MTTSASIQITGNGKAVDPVETGRQLAEEQHYRVDAYRLIATMLRTPPDALFLDQLSRLSRVEAPDELSLSVSMLGLAARASGADAVNDEFHRLFIGLGRGELVPYASWYLTGFLMEKPLGELRRHLAEMGFERQNGVCEPEDHIAALCEVMSILVLESRPHAETAGFSKPIWHPGAGDFSTT